MSDGKPVAVIAAEVAPHARQTNYPEAFKSLMARREKRRLGDVFGLANFGVNLTRLAPGGISALRHAHARQDEFVYVLEGEPTLVSDSAEMQLGPGMCAGFKAGTGDAHHLVNRTGRDIVFLEIGDRSPGDTVEYPDDDVAATLAADGSWRYTRKDGTPF
jgi:uncharacterized cupin superfamily protein